MKIREAFDDDFDAILAVINEAAHAYRGVIPNDRWHEPYMSADELAKEIAAGVAFWMMTSEEQLVGVMGIQDKEDVVLVRHAYTAATAQRKGIGTKLLRRLETLADKPMLIGTWADASWAIEFYRRNGFLVVESAEAKNHLLRTYWSVPARQMESSVVLADKRWMERQSHLTGIQQSELG